MKCGPFAPGGLCCPADQHYYDPLRLPLGRPDHFPGSPVIGGHRFPHPAGDGAETALPSSQDDHPHVQRPIRRRVPQRPLLDPERFPWPSPLRDRLGSLSSRPQAGLSDDACSGFTHVADRTVASPRFAPGLSTTHGGHCYQGSRHLPGPDSHRQAALNLSLRYVMSIIPSSQRRSSLGAPCSDRRNRAGRSG